MTNPIDQVHARLDDGRLWQKGDVGFYDIRTEPVCLIGACHFATTLGMSIDTLAVPLIQVIQEQYPERADRGSGPDIIAPFNDHPLTTWADVELVLEKASVRWDETHV